MATVTIPPASKPATRFEIPGGLLARNAALNFVCGALPMIVGVVSIPYVIHKLGTERFGILSLAWVFSGYLGFLGLGLGPATTKFAAELLGKGKETEVPSLLWTAASLSCVLGFVATALLTLSRSFIVERVFKLQGSTASEASSVFLLIAISFPVVFATGPVRGLLEAAQRFDLINAVNLPSSSANYMIPAIVVWLGLGLPAIVGALMVSKAVVALVYLLLDLRIFPNLKKRLQIAPQLVGRILRFGGWVSVTTVVAPFMSYLDRFLIGAIISMAAVAYYTAPCEALMRSAIFPAALIGVMFPAFSFWNAQALQHEIQNAFVRSLRYVLLIVGPLAVFLVCFARQILTLWLGASFAEQATPAFRLLACVLLASSVAWLPHALLQAVGRPDIPAKFLLAEIPFYAACAWWLVSKEGIAGAALAFLLRTVVHGVLLFAACFHLNLASFKAFADGLAARSAAVVGGLGAAAAALASLSFSLPANLLGIAGLIFAFALAAWVYAFRLDERVQISLLVRQLRFRTEDLQAPVVTRD
jgi:O-antigen/teichoic acid export membrane protein